MNTQVVSLFLVGLAVSIALPLALAQAPLPDQGQTCVPVQKGTAACVPVSSACMAQQNWTCLEGKCPAANTPPSAGRKGGTETNCAEFVCQTLGADLPGATTPPTCQDTLCRDIPALYGTAVTSPVAGLFGLVPAVAPTLYPIVLRLAVVCNPGYGGGGGAGCNEIVYTPVARVGFHASLFPNVGGGSASVVQCAWATSSMGGYTYVGESDITSAGTLSGCSEKLVLVPIFGSAGTTYVFTNGCPPLP